MSRLLINEYLAEIDRLRRYSGTSTEKVVSEAFKDLLKRWSRQAGLHFVPQHDYDTALRTRVTPDGAVLHDLRVPLGWWEAKDTADDLDTEIAKKLRRGYPRDNIVFENSATAALYQNGAEVMRCEMTDLAALERLLALFFGYERPEIAEFRKAVAQFRDDLPRVLDALREKIEAAYATNPGFRAAALAPLGWPDSHAYVSITSAPPVRGDLEAIRIIGARSLASHYAEQERLSAGRAREK
jgi:hypothetical protein